MAERAHITSTDALETFRAALVVYGTKARMALDQACDEVSRIRQWLELEQRPHWEAETRRCTKALEQAQQALFSARLANLREPTAAELQGVRQARRKLEAAEGKLRMIKQWVRDYENRAAPWVRQLETLRTMLAHDVPKATTYLAEAIGTLDDYTHLSPPEGRA